MSFIRKLFGDQGLSKGLLKAVTDGQLNEVKKLINKRNIDSKDKDNATLLMWSAFHGHTEIAKHLIESGADVNVKGSNTNDTALMVAARYERTEIVKLLISAGADVNDRNDGGSTALIQSTRYGEIVEVLISAGADVYAKHRGGLTALMTAEEGQNYDAINLLRECMKNIEQYSGEMLFVKGGTFEMGDWLGHKSDQASTISRYCGANYTHTVELNDFYIGKYPVTFELYDKYCDSTGIEKPNDEGWGRGQRPVINVDWRDINEFCTWLSKKIGRGYKYRLPTEAEWEYAARGGGKNIRWAGTDNKEELGEYAWLWEIKTQPVGQKKPNCIGLYDMTGNVWEWVSDLFAVNYYPSSPRKNPQGPDTPLGPSYQEEYGGRVSRGCNYDCNDPLYARTTSRRSDSEDGCAENGFRIARTID